MHGDRETLRIPTYGNKVIGVRNGILDLHGVERDVTWTQLSQTITVGDDEVYLMEEVDW